MMASMLIGDFAPVDVSDACGMVHTSLSLSLTHTHTCARTRTVRVPQNLLNIRSLDWSEELLRGTVGY